jgi:hypothetical protein
MPSRRQTYQGHQNASPFAGGMAFTFGRNWRSNYDIPYHLSGYTHSAAIRGLYEHRSPRNNNCFNSRGHGYPAALRGLYPHSSFRNRGLSGDHAYPAALGGLYGCGSYRRR